MRVKIEDVIYFIRDAQFSDAYVCLYPMDTPFFYRVDFDAAHTKEQVLSTLLERGYLDVDWMDAVEEAL